MELTSNAFKEGDLIPKKFTCDGDDISPQLAWSDIPSETKSLILIMDDPDAPAGTWDHWIVFNIPPQTYELSENIQTLPAGGKGGQNSWKHNTYDGPCPPDKGHRYFFNREAKISGACPRAG